MRFFLYQLLIHTLIVLSPLKFIYRSIKQPDYLKHLAERYGVYNLKNIKNHDLIWFHCVSLGETKAINSLLSHLVPKFKDKYFLVTHSTPTGRNTEIYKSNRIFRAYLCFDSWFLNKLFLNYFKPKVAIFLETEIWPGITKELKLMQTTLRYFSVSTLMDSAGYHLRTRMGFFSYRWGAGGAWLGT